MSVAAIVLAAGESQRMGRSKPLLDWGDKPLLQHQIDVLVAVSCDPVVAVLGHRAPQVRAAVNCDAPCKLVENPAYRSGRASSVRLGALAVADSSEAILIASVDQPLRAETVARLIVAHAEGSAVISVPRHGGNNGHPTIFAGALLEELRHVDEEGEGLRAVRRAHEGGTVFINVDDPSVTVNLNTPEDYERARTSKTDGR